MGREDIAKLSSRVRLDFMRLLVMDAKPTSVPCACSAAVGPSATSSTTDGGTIACKLCHVSLGRTTWCLRSRDCGRGAHHYLDERVHVSPKNLAMY